MKIEKRDQRLKYVTIFCQLNIFEMWTSHLFTELEYFFYHISSIAAAVRLHMAK